MLNICCLVNFTWDSCPLTLSSALHLPFLSACPLWSLPCGECAKSSLCLHSRLSRFSPLTPCLITIINLTCSPPGRKPAVLTGICSDCSPAHLSLTALHSEVRRQWGSPPPSVSRWPGKTVHILGKHGHMRLGVQPMLCPGPQWAPAASWEYAVRGLIIWWVWVKFIKWIFTISLSAFYAEYFGVIMTYFRYSWLIHSCRDYFWNICYRLGTELQPGAWWRAGTKPSLSSWNLEWSQGDNETQSDTCVFRWIWGPSHTPQSINSLLVSGSAGIFINFFGLTGASQCLSE